MFWMIDMFLNMGQPTIPTDEPLIYDWQTQTKIETLLLYAVLICVPLMLFVKPIWIMMTAPKPDENPHLLTNPLDLALFKVLNKVPTIKDQNKQSQTKVIELSSLSKTDRDDDFQKV